mgnify:CR=1 FL=1
MNIAFLNQNYSLLCLRLLLLAVDLTEELGCALGQLGRLALVAALQQRALSPRRAAVVRVEDERADRGRRGGEHRSRRKANQPRRRRRARQGPR